MSVNLRESAVNFLKVADNTFIFSGFARRYAGVFLTDTVKLLIFNGIYLKTSGIFFENTEYVLRIFVKVLCFGESPQSLSVKPLNILVIIFISAGKPLQICDTFRRRQGKSPCTIAAGIILFILTLRIADKRAWKFPLPEMFIDLLRH